MTVNNIKIPAKHYVGMTKREVEKIPLGFITPWGEDAAAKKRMTTVDTWSRQNRNKTFLEPMTIDNVPLNGFKMTTDIRSSSYGGVDKWRIEDPRGFELEITSHNLAQLLTVGMIDRGEIMDTCVWARDGQQNVLLSTATDEYKAAVQNTQVANMTADWKTVKIGNTVLLQNNITGVWLGRMFGMSVQSYSHNSLKRGQNQLTISDKSTHVIYVETPEDKNYTHKLLLVNSPKLAAITDTASMSEIAAEEMVNRLLVDKTCRVESSGYSSYIALTIGSPKIGETATLSLKPIQVSSVEQLETLTSYRSSHYVYKKGGSEYLYKITTSRDYKKNGPVFTCHAVSQPLFDQHQLVSMGKMERNKGYWGSHNDVWTETSHAYEFDPRDEFYAAVVTINTKSGSTIEALVN